MSKGVGYSGMKFTLTRKAASNLPRDIVIRGPPNVMRQVETQRPKWGSRRKIVNNPATR